MKLLTKNFNLKKIVLFVSLLFLTIYLPLIITIYTPTWYHLNYNFQDTYNYIDKNEAQNSTSNLVGFFLYQNNLNEQWNENEIIHMTDVRSIYFKLFILATLSISSIFYFKDKKILSKYAKTNLKVIPSFIIILPFFQIFWRYIFHPILFSNNYWKIYPSDISYYLFPLQFFIISFLYIIITSLILNYIIYKKLK